MSGEEVDLINYTTTVNSISESFGLHPFHSTDKCFTPNFEVLSVLAHSFLCSPFTVEWVTRGGDIGGGRGGLSPPTFKSRGAEPPKKADWVSFFYQR